MAETVAAQRREYAGALQLRQEILLAMGPVRIADAEKRLCATCRYREAEGVCGLNGLILPMTSKGEDCPYYFAK